MNELIEHLAERATKEMDQEAFSEDMNIPAEWYQKFAELIVKECLDISHRESHLPNAVLFDERSDKFIKDIHNRVARATREHFGVEE